MYDINQPVDPRKPTGQTYTVNGYMPQLPPPVTPEQPNRSALPKKRPFYSFLMFRKGPSGKKPLLILCASGLIILLAAGGAAYHLLYQYHPKVIPAAKPAHKYVPPPKPKIVPSMLTGLPVDPSVNDRTVTGVMIENSIDARPQSGLDAAGVIFEAVAEGGVTRFLALFQDTQPDYLGPVRSARYYYIDWLLGFDAAYAHVGGSPEALADIPAWHVKDMNEFYSAGFYHRISTRYAPHNVYTSTAELNTLEQQKGYTSHYTGFDRKDKETPLATPTTTSIDMAMSGFYYNPHFAYDPASNTYKRSEAGTPHMELHKDGSQVQIAPKVVVAMIVPRHEGALDTSGAYYSQYSDIGSGKVYVFQDGGLQTGTWSKPDRNTQISFTDDQGKPLKFDPGQTWITAVKQDSDLTYK